MCCKSAIIMEHIVSNPVIVIINKCLATYLFLRSSQSQFVSLALPLNLSHFRIITREMYFTSIYKPHYSFSLAQTSQAARLKISNSKRNETWHDYERCETVMVCSLLLPSSSTLDGPQLIRTHLDF